MISHHGPTEIMSPDELFHPNALPRGSSLMFQIVECRLQKNLENRLRPGGEICPKQRWNWKVV